MYELEFSAILTGEWGEMFKSALFMTLTLSGLGIAGALVLGTITAVLRLSRVRIFTWPAAAYIEFFRNTPLLLQIYFWYFAVYPILIRSNFLGLGFLRDLPGFWPEIIFGTAALTVFTAAFIAEEIRSGINTIPKTQLEASRASGLSFLGAMRFVILPQAFRIVIPPLISQFLNLIKNSSLVMALGVMELTLVARRVGQESGRTIEAFIVSTLIYITISLLVSFFIAEYNKRVLRTIKY